MKQIKILQLILRFKIFRINKVNLNYCYMLELTERKQTRNRQHPDIQNLTANKIKTLSCYFKVSAQMTIIRWSRFTVRRLTQGPVKYTFYKILRIVVYQVTFIKIKNKGFPSMAPDFPKYQGSLFKMLLFTASNSESAKKRMLRECQMSSSSSANNFSSCR